MKKRTYAKRNHLLRHSCVMMLMLLFCTFFAGEIYGEQHNQLQIFVTADKTAFYSGNPVHITIHVKNISAEPAEVSLYDIPYTSYQPVVFDMIGHEAEMIVSHRLQDQDITSLVAGSKPRKVTIAPGESIAHPLNLLDFYKLENDRKYRVKGFFLPDAKEKHMLRSDNMVYFTIHAPLEEKTYYEVKTFSREITPAEVITLFLQAEHDHKSEHYIKYINLEKYIQAFSDYAMVYNTSNDAYRKKVVRDFVSFLAQPRTDYIVDFKIINETILKEKNMAIVQARVIRYGGVYNFAYTYRYSLEKFRDFWLITDVEASVAKDIVK